jgi:thiol:disulfide interchange protein DsbC
MKQVLKTRDDIAFFIKLLPLTAIHPESYKKSKAIVCAGTGERALEMLENAFEGKALPEPACETDVLEKNTALAQQLGISGTPNLVFENGKVVPGAMSAADIIKTIDGLKKP